MNAASMFSPISGSVRERTLLLLKIHGPQTVAQLAKMLAVTKMAVRQHLAILEAQELVTYTDAKHKVGRPARLWQLTPKAYNKFPDYHAKLTIEMFEAVRHIFGEDGLERLIKERTQEQIQSYLARMPKLEAPIEERLDMLAQIRREEGYMAEWKYKQDGKIEFVENHCSISNAAGFCSKLCAEEMSLFRTVLGDKININRAEHILNGDRCCCYHITEL